MLGNIRQYEICRYGRDLIETRLAELALDVVLRREPEATMRLKTHVRGLPRRLRRQVLRHVCLGATRLVRVEQPARLPAHEVRRLDLHVTLGDRKLHPLILSDRPSEDDALFGIRARLLDE